MKLLTVQFSPTSYHFIPLWSKFSPQHPVLGTLSLHIAHNVRIGKNCILAGASNVAGSSTLGDNVVLAGNAGVGDNINIGSNTVIFASTSVLTDIPPNSKIYGTPTADDYGSAMRRRALYNKLPEIYDRLKALEGKQQEWE